MLYTLYFLVTTPYMIKVLHDISTYWHSVQTAVRPPVSKDRYSPKQLHDMNNLLLLIHE
jgi:hypothetical protein